MTRTKKLAALFAGALTVAPLLGTSAFADWRHRDGTDRYERRDDRGRGDDRYRNDDRSRNDNRYRNDNRGRSDSYRYDGRQRETFSGRVSRIDHYRGGYRVWVGGGRYPLFIPEARYRRCPLRVGVSINLGGYWNPAGYYDVYNYSNPYYTSGDLRGIVESVDYRRGTLVLRDDISGSFVTTVLRGSDPRLGSLRPGDSVELSGAWNRAGVFDAYSVLNIGYDRYERRY